MINGKRVVALIPARGGSKSVKNKNIKLLGKKPLIAWSIEVALNTPEIDRVLVSTDNKDIKKISKEYGAETIDRPANLAEDNSLVIDTIRHSINYLSINSYDADIMVLLEPTSPFRKVNDIRECIELIANEDYDSVATFTHASLNPNRAWRIQDGKPGVFIEGAIPWLPRQSLPAAYQLNGAVYAFRINNLPENQTSLLFGKNGAVIMPEDRSIDIDDEIHFDLAETIIKRSVNNE